MLATAWRCSSGILLKGTPSSHATTLRPRPSMATRSCTNDTNTGRFFDPPSRRFRLAVEGPQDAELTEVAQPGHHIRLVDG